MNNAFKRLQSVVPGQVVPEDTTATDKADQSSKLSKINTLKLAVNYISALTQILKQTDGEKHRFSRSTTTIINPVTPAKCHLNSSPSIVTSGEQNRPTVRYKCEPVPSRRPDDNFEYQQQQQQHYHRPYDYQQAKSFAPPSAYNPYQASSTTTPSIVDYDSTTAAMSTATTHTSDTNLDNILLDFDAFFDDFDSENLTMLMNWWCAIFPNVFICIIKIFSMINKMGRSSELNYASNSWLIEFTMQFVGCRHARARSSTVLNSPQKERARGERHGGSDKILDYTFKVIVMGMSEAHPHQTCSRFVQRASTPKLIISYGLWCG